VTGLRDIYRALMARSIAIELQYRASMFIWMIGTVLEPVIYLTVWSVIAQGQGGEVGGFAQGEFAAYFIMMMLVNHYTFSWVMWEYEFYVREGMLSPLLLKPVHPIHNDLANNLAYKLITTVVILPVAALLVVLFQPTVTTELWAVVAFVPVLLLGFALRFAVEWTLALSAFWLTRTSAINQMYFFALLFFSGRFAPLPLLPPIAQALSWVLPFRWMVYFPVEVALGHLTPMETLMGVGAQMAWLGLAIMALNLVWRRGVRRFAGVGA
jgi:ABC-2 type transport system permease protein